MMHSEKTFPPAFLKGLRKKIPALVLLGVVGGACFSCITSAASTPANGESLVEIERARILTKASQYLAESPITVTDVTCERSEGGLHDFYSEGDYWWPDPANPEGAYIRRDGESNPDAFLAHREAMLRLAEITGTLASAWVLTEDASYATAVMDHLKAWFVEPDTRMNPNLCYGQAIKGLHSGRSIGIIDTLHLIEVARALKTVQHDPTVDPEMVKAVTSWFSEYLHWLNTHPYGLQEKKHPNNHGVCWSLQAATFADLIGDETTLAWIRHEFLENYLPLMMAMDGSFPAELARTKPYGYSLFVVDAMAGIAQVASTESENLWLATLPDGRGMKLAVEFITPFIIDKSTWPYGHDIQNWEAWPVRHCTLLFAALAFRDAAALALWRGLEADPTTFETLRNFPIRHPLLWVENPQAELP